MNWTEELQELTVESLNIAKLTVDTEHTEENRKYKISMRQKSRSVEFLVMILNVFICKYSIRELLESLVDLCERNERDVNNFEDFRNNMNKCADILSEAAIKIKDIYKI